MFIGGAGKSAMFPLHIWLPDAMEGPTPVSALIHAATMVVAGVVQIARLFPIWIEYAPQAMEIVVYVGAFTAFYAAAVACAQSDIKRVLAFSTISADMKRILMYLVATLVFATAAGAQGWFRQPTPNDTLRSTVILPDNSVVFQIYAPEAKSVAVAGDRHEPSLEILIHIARIGKVSLDWLCCNDTLDKSYTEERLYSDPQWQRFVNFAYGKRIDPSRLRNLIQDMFSLNQP